MEQPRWEEEEEEERQIVTAHPASATGTPSTPREKKQV